MEQNHKNTDCYFFYYSKCSKGDNCAFRHEPSALGCETVCSYWQQGNCLNEHCNFRHMELKKNRKSIPCYWEGQPSGCMKPHCPFLHRNARPVQNTPINQVKSPETISTKPANQEWSNRQEDSKFDGSSTESDQGRGSSEAGSFIGSPAVEPLIVNFEEESDSEGASSPVKRKSRVPYCKTYEEIRLEEIQAESAAYYSYKADDYLGGVGGGKVKKIPTVRDRRTVYLFSRDKAKTSDAVDLNFKVLSLEEIRRRKNLASSSESAEILKTKIEERSTEEFLKDAMKTLEELKEIDKAKAVNKRKFSELENFEEAQEAKILKVLETKVPPVRLRRCLKLTKIGDEIENENEAKVQESELEKRLISKIEDESSLGRRRKVEVRLCDSSTTDDDRTLESEEKISVGTETTDCDKLEVCDSILGVGEDEILKDIDALLKTDA